MNSILTRTGACAATLLHVSLLAAAAAGLASCSREPRPEFRTTQTAVPPQQKPAETEPTTGRERPLETQTGVASFISDRLRGRKTASGEPYDGTQLVAAHPTHPLGTRVRVTHRDNGRAVEVRIVDRSARARDSSAPIIDLSRAAAERLGFISDGTAPVTVEVLERGRDTAR